MGPALWLRPGKDPQAGGWSAGRDGLRRAWGGRDRPFRSGELPRGRKGRRHHPWGSGAARAKGASCRTARFGEPPHLGQLGFVAHVVLR